MKRKVPESLKFKDYLIAAVELEGIEPSSNEEIISFLHAYLCLSFRVTAEPKPSTVTLSSKVSFALRGKYELSPM